MQLSIHRVDRAHFVIEKAIARAAESASSDGGAVFRVDPALALPDVCRLFGIFTFPLLELTKVQMGRIARQRGWDDIMRLTWFCQRPLPGPRPCGTCNPCAYTIREGLGWRLPLVSRARYFLLRQGVETARTLARGLLRAVGLK